MKLEVMCRACPKKCCKGPGMSTEEYHKIRDAIGKEANDRAKPKYNGKYWKYQAETCPALGENGCILEYECRPLLCKIAPFVPIPTVEHGTVLLLNVGECMMWEQFGKLYKSTQQEYDKIMGVKK